MAPKSSNDSSQCAVRTGAGKWPGSFDSHRRQKTQGWAVVTGNPESSLRRVWGCSRGSRRLHRAVSSRQFGQKSVGAQEWHSSPDTSNSSGGSSLSGQRTRCPTPRSCDFGLPRDPSKQGPETSETVIRAPHTSQSRVKAAGT